MVQSRRRVQPSLISFICGKKVTLNYLQKAGYNRSKFTQFCCIIQRPGYWYRKIFGDCRCSIVVVFGVLVTFGENIRLATQVKRRVLGPRNMSISERLHHHRLRWLGHVLRILTTIFPGEPCSPHPKVAERDPLVVIT